MKFKRTKMNAIASGVALGLAAMSAQAADQPTLTTAGSQTSAVFTGGATINGGASFLTAVPADSAVDLLVTIKPAATDVGKAGNLIVIINVPGVGFFIQDSSGGFSPWTEADPIVAASSKTLAALESLTIFNGLVGSAVGATGVDVQAYLGYYTDSIANLTYSSTPASFSIAAVAASTCPAYTTAISGTFKDKSVFTGN